MDITTIGALNDSTVRVCGGKIIHSIPEGSQDYGWVYEVVSIILNYFKIKFCYYV